MYCPYSKAFLPTTRKSTPHAQQTVPRSACCCATVNVIPDKPNYIVPKTVKPGSSEVLDATNFLSSLGGPKHAHQVCLDYYPRLSKSQVTFVYDSWQWTVAG